MKFISTRFGKQTSNCKIKPGITLQPTQEEMELSCLVRPGMRGGREIKQILNPGTYSFSAADLGLEPNGKDEPEVTELRAGQTQKPYLTEIESAIWSESSHKDWHITIRDFKDIIPVPVEEADDEKLGYYGCRLLKQDDCVKLTHRSITIDFIYGKDYFEDYVLGVNGGSGIEHHGFAHIDTPLDDNSGYLVLGKVFHQTGELHLTAFHIPKGTSVYIPADSVHTNDYMLGRWQTLISPACNFPSAKLRSVAREPLKLDIAGAAPLTQNSSHEKIHQNI